MTRQKTDLSKQFRRFAGREVKVSEKIRSYTVASQTFTATTVHLHKNNPAVKELATAVKAAGLQLRLWTASSIGTMDYRLDRLNARVEKHEDGTYRIGKLFTLG